MLALLALLPLAHADHRVDAKFNDAIAKVEAMVWTDSIQRMVSEQGLVAVNVTWEDTGRYKGSSVGPNISDMTIGVRDPSGALHPMPVVRFDNFSDRTADVDIDQFRLRVGNEDGDELHTASLEDVLADPRKYLHDPRSWTGRQESLWNARDEHVLVSAQACFLPIPQEGEATFTPVIYNYQSYPGAPAVMTIVATREGTSITVVENDDGYMSEVLYFNDDGQRAPFTAMRQSDFVAQGGDETNPGASADDPGLNAVLIIQVPLKQPELRRDDWGMYDMMGGAAEMSAPAPATKSARSMESDVENAVIGHGETEGPFTEIHDLSIQRDTRFPVRVTVQFYKATSNGIVTAGDVEDIRAQIDRVYEDADYVGSLVVDGHTNRPTEWVKPPETAVWADGWWGRLKAN